MVLAGNGRFRIVGKFISRLWQTMQMKMSNQAVDNFQIELKGEDAAEVDLGILPGGIHFM